MFKWFGSRSTILALMTIIGGCNEPSAANPQAAKRFAPVTAPSTPYRGPRDVLVPGTHRIDNRNFAMSAIRCVSVYGTPRKNDSTSYADSIKTQ